MATCNLNVIVVLEFISRDLYLLFAILFSSKFQNSIFYQHMRPKSGLKFPRPFSSPLLLSFLQNLCNNSDQNDFVIHSHSLGPSWRVENRGLLPI